MNTPLRPRRRVPSGPFALLAVALVFGGCEGSGPGQLVSLDDRRGIVDVVVFVDRNRSEAFDAADRPLAGAMLGIGFPGSPETLDQVSTSVTGRAYFESVPIGSLGLRLDPGPLGDSLVLSSQNPDPLRLVPGDSLPVLVGVSYPIVGIAEARGSQSDRTVFVEGIAVNASGALPAAAMHVRGATGWLRAEATEGAVIAAGDSVRIRGVIHREGGTVVLREGLRSALPGGGSVAAIDVTTQAAAAADPALDAALVRISSAAVSQTVVQGGIATIQVNDGSGALFVEVPGAHFVGAGLPIPRGGSTVSLTGVLIPQPGGTRWVLRTRSGTDVAITTSGSIQGRVFVDRDGTGSFSPEDLPLEGVRITARAAQIDGGVLGEGITGSDGRFQIGPVPTGGYVVEPDPFTYPDSLQVGTISPSPLVVQSNQVTSVTVPLVPPAAGTSGSRPEAGPRAEAPPHFEEDG